MQLLLCDLLANIPTGSLVSALSAQLAAWLVLKMAMICRYSESSATGLDGRNFVLLLAKPPEICVMKTDLSCSEVWTVSLAARAEIPGSCCRFADAVVDVELGREIGSVVCVGSGCGSSMVQIGRFARFSRCRGFVFDCFLADGYRSVRFL